MNSFELYNYDISTSLIIITTGGLTNAVLMLANRLRWWSIITSALHEHYLL